MTVLITGGTGTVGAHVIDEVRAHGVPVRTTSRNPDDAGLPDEIEVVTGSLSDVAAMRKALEGIDGLFLLSPVTADELTGSLITLDLAREAGVASIVYLSMIHADKFTEVPHSAAKFGVERALDDLGVCATVLRPGMYMQNDLAERERLTVDRVYSPPIGNESVLFTDVRDLAEIGALELLRRLHDPDSPTNTLDVVAPQILGGNAVAAIWSDVLGREITYGGDDLEQFEGAVANSIPGWHARDLRQMFRRIQSDGLRTEPTTNDVLQGLINRPMRTYDEFARDAAEDWSA